MWRRFLALPVVLAAAAQARGLIIDFVEVDNTVFGVDPLHPNFNDAGWQTYDLRVTPGGDDWSSASIDAYLVGGVLFQHMAGGDVEPPMPVLLDFPAMEFDTFFADPPALFDGEQPIFFEGPDWSDTTVTALWYDYGQDFGGTHTLARFTFTGDIWLSGAMSHSDGDSLFYYEFTTVPTPGSVFLLPALLTLRTQGGRRS